MASERDLELLDNYIGNRLDAQQRSAFEKQLNADPELKNELDFQQQIVDGLRTARAAQLKAMLGAIPTPPLHGGGEVSLPTKVGMWVAASAVVGAGLYFYLRPTEQPEKPAQPSTEVHPKQDTPKTPDSIAKDEPSSPAEENQAPIESSATKETTANATSPKKTTTTATTDSPSTKPEINAFNPLEEEGSSTPGAAEIDPAAKASKEMKTPVETNSTSKKYTFHYQFTGGKIILYGPFESNLYEIMEFFGGAKQQVFLYHQNNYYLMTNDGDKIKPLVPINDPKLLEKLKEYRQKNN